MAKFAWVENGIIRDVCMGIPGDLYHPDVAKLYTSTVPDNSSNGDLWDGTILTKKAIPVPIAVPPTITKTHFLLAFTSAERIKARSLRATDAVLDDFWMILDTADTVNLALPSVQNGIEYTLNAVRTAGLTTLNIPARKAEILAGKLQ